MKIHGRIFPILLCITLVLTLSGCESQNLHEAKEYVAKIYDYTMDKAALEVELSKYKGGTSSADFARVISIEGQIDACDRLIEHCTEKLHKLFVKLSAEEQQKVKDYTKEVFEDMLTDIWN